LQDTRVESWAELQEALYDASWQEELGRFRSNFAFRGEGDSASTLVTSLARLGGDYAAVETHLVRNFRRYARLQAVPEDTVWSWLTVGKHHGLPTRLLDWSHSPLVALHFATADVALFDRDGTLWMVDYVQAHGLLPAQLREVLAGEGSNVFTAEMLDEVASSLEQLDELVGEEVVLFFEPPSLDDRIVNQYALFSLMSSPSARLDQWLAAHPPLGRRVVIPAGLKWEIRDKLDQANVNERVLFPGLDGLSAWLARYYTRRAPS
jgi:FRG domain